MAQSEPHPLEALAKLETNDQLREIRKLEAKNEALDAQLKAERAKRLLAEHDLHVAEQRAELAFDTTGDPQRLHDMPLASAGKSTAVICLTDWHVEETVDPATINGKNAYDLAIAEQRITRTFHKAIYLLDFVRNICDIRDLVVWLGGDFISGYIHDELEESNQLSPPEAMMWAQERVHAGLKFLLETAQVDSITVPCNYGNHARVTQKTRIATRAKNSYEWLMYKNLSRQFSHEPRVQFKIEGGYHNICDIQGWRVRFHHGDAVRYGGGVGGITIPMNKAVAQWDKSQRCDYSVSGHYHTWMDHWNWTSVGCLIGYNAYALEIKADYQPPTQGFLVFDEQYGKVLAVPIFCEEA